MKKLFLSLLSLVISMTMFAQSNVRKMNLIYDGQVVYSRAVSLIDSIKFVTDQAPSPGSSVPKGSAIVLYLGAERAAETVPMPDLSGMTYQEAKEALEKVGLYLNATGTGETGKVFAQEVEPNTPVEVARQWK